MGVERAHAVVRHRTAIRTVGNITRTQFFPHVVSLERPTDGPADSSFPCPSCGDSLSVRVLPGRRVVRTRKLSLVAALGGIVVVLVLLVLALLTWNAALQAPAGSLAGSNEAFLFAVCVTALLGTVRLVFWCFSKGANYEGVSALRDSGVDSVRHQAALAGVQVARHDLARGSMAREYVDIEPDLVVELDPRRE